MGGPRRAPGDIVGERIIHVDNPAVRKKFEKLSDEITADCRAQVEDANHKLAALKSDHGLTLKMLEDAQSECRRLSNIRQNLTPIGNAVEPKSVFNSPDEKEMERLRTESKSLREMLLAANVDVARLKKEQAAAPVSQYPAPIIEFRDRVIQKPSHRLALVSALVAFALGVACGYSLHPIPKPESAPIVVKKSAEVRK